ncbi:ABC transporter permease [Chryseobacterium lactis]|uniref:ABC transporter permease n=1 Tax=Chryseobacterium lactis TaxID=1241981 RepID=A0A3G6RGB5_CHRLC|nr:ABC transporter permease [Chryseobacterium lactis]AZA83707.1 ABC transporter permease [Chryseobacterium lactis]AZB04092.1 ABC transporter permease [Chryseobacterium lactis]PNW13000.1 ABC transporter permease [Chryseobacterium lactis]
MKTMRFILKKEFRQIFRDKIILAMMFVMPTVQLIIMPLAANFEVKNINIVYIDHDHSSYSQKLIYKIISSGYFKLAGGPNSYKEGLKMIEEGTADVVLEISPGFERNLVREGSQKINLSVDAINGTKSSVGGSYLLSVLADFNTNLDVNIKSPNGTVTVRPAKINIENSNWYNPRAEYKYYMVPGILVLLLTLIGGFITALNIVKEKEIGTIEQINVTPIKKWQFILGKLIPFWIVGMTVFTIGLIVMYVIYGIFPEGSLLTLYTFAAVYLIALLGLGLLISTFADTQLQAMFIAFFFMMIFMLMSGFFTNTESMPDWAIIMSNFTPVTHFIKVVRLIVLKGSRFSEVKNEFFYLIGFAVVLNGLAIFNYRKTS